MEILSPQETKVFNLWTQGLMNKQIAFDMGLSPKTISTYKSRIKAKFKVGSDYEFFKLALQIKPKSAPNKKNVWIWTEAKNLRRSGRHRGLKEKRVS